MSVFCLSTSAFFASRSATARSYNRAFSIFIAVALFFPWLRSCWHETTMPEGRCVMRTADDVLLTCWPPFPDARKTSIRRRSEEHTSELQSPVHLVCRLLLEKKKKNNNT